MCYFVCKIQRVETTYLKLDNMYPAPNIAELVFELKIISEIIKPCVSQPGVHVFPRCTRGYAKLQEAEHIILEKQLY